MTHPLDARPSGLVFVVAVTLGAVVFALPARADGDPEKGRAFAEKHCSRCHVVGGHNPLGGANNTASFQMIAKMSDALERFRTFYARRPHPVFVRVPGVQRWSNVQGYAAEIAVTPEQVDDIVAFVKTLETMPIRRKRK
ncbi:MAG: c-type cytochrome [Rhodospirillales bacterium]